MVENQKMADLDKDADLTFQKGDLLMAETMKEEGEKEVQNGGADHNTSMAGTKTFEDVLASIGRRGRFQMMLLVMVALVTATLHYQNSCTVFTLMIPRHRCKIPYLENDTYSPQDPTQNYLVSRYIPQTSDGEYQKCKLLTSANSSESSLYEQDAQGQGNTTQCSEWVFDKTVMRRTIVSDLSIVCDNKALRSHTNMVLFIGKMAAALLQGNFSDKFGRRTSLIVSVLGIMATAIGSAFVINQMSALVFRAMAGFFATCCYLSIVVIGVEFLDIKQRSYMTIITKIVSGVCEVSMALLAYFLRDWKLLQLSIAWPAVIALIMCWFIPESPRWLASKKRTKQAKRTLQYVANLNGTTLSADLLQQVCHRNDKVKRPSVLKLFADVRLVARWVVLYINWIALCMAAYGLMFNLSNLKGNIFVNVAIGGVLDTTACLITGFIVNKVSRKYFYVASVVFAACACLATFIPILVGAPDTFVIGLSLIGKAGSTAAYTLIYTFSAELFPTTFRGVGLGSCSMMSRIGGVIAPYVADLSLYTSGELSQILPQLVLGSVALAGSLLALTLPETRDKELPETLEDIKRDGKKRPKSTEINVVV